jgi:hypothetical protein
MRTNNLLSRRFPVYLLQYLQPVAYLTSMHTTLNPTNRRIIILSRGWTRRPRDQLGGTPAHRYQSMVQTLLRRKV